MFQLMLPQKQQTKAKIHHYFPCTLTITTRVTAITTKVAAITTKVTAIATKVTATTTKVTAITTKVRNIYKQLSQAIQVAIFLNETLLHVETQLDSNHRLTLSKVCVNRCTTFWTFSWSSMLSLPSTSLKMMVISCVMFFFKMDSAIPSSVALSEKLKKLQSRFSL